MNRRYGGRKITGTFMNRTRRADAAHCLSQRLLVLTTILASTLPAIAAKGLSQPVEDRIAQAVERKLLQLPFYMVFDNLNFHLIGNDVILLGQVTRPILKSDAEKAVTGISGVTRVENRIEILPLSPTDDKIRLAEYLAVYGCGGVNAYGLQSGTPIHIIVKNGNVTLEGTVHIQSDKMAAFTQASSVPGVLSLTDHLRVAADATY